MATNPQAQEETQADIDARLALIREAVEEKLASKATSLKKTVGQEPDALNSSTCPIDPMERLLCESCQ